MKKVQRFFWVFFFCMFQSPSDAQIKSRSGTVCEWTSNPVTQLKASQIKGLDLFPVCNNLILNIIVLLIILN